MGLRTELAIERGAIATLRAQRLPRREQVQARARGAMRWSTQAKPRGRGACLRHCLARAIARAKQRTLSPCVSIGLLPRHKARKRDVVVGHDGLSRQMPPLPTLERSVCFPSVAPLRPRSSTPCAKSRTAAESCGPLTHP